MSEHEDAKNKRTKNNDHKNLFQQVCITIDFNIVNLNSHTVCKISKIAKILTKQAGDKFSNSLLKW